MRADKEREASDGHDGTWVAHPGLVGIAMEVFDRTMFGPNQMFRQRRSAARSRPPTCCKFPQGEITREGLRTNVAVGLRYLESWLRGNGCVPIFNLMEDAATAEISRAQIWQWIRHPAGRFADGTKVTVELVEIILSDELEAIHDAMGSQAYADSKFDAAGKLFLSISTAEEFVEFLTLAGVRTCWSDPIRYLFCPDARLFPFLSEAFSQTIQASFLDIFERR